MFGYTRIKTAELNALQAKIDGFEAELKGYYGDTGLVNQYLQIIAPQLKGLEMNALKSMSRLQIKEAYETIAPVMGVINYIAADS